MPTNQPVRPRPIGEKCTTTTFCARAHNLLTRDQEKIPWTDAEAEKAIRTADSGVCAFCKGEPW